MSPPPLADTDRYIHAGETRVYWAPAIVDVQDPLRSELDAGTDLTGQIAVVSGWVARAVLVEMQGVNEEFVSTIEGSLSVSDATLIMYADRNGSGGDIRTLLSRGDQGHVVFLHGGDVVGNPMDVWPVRVASIGRPVEIGNEPARVDVQFAVSRQPGLDLSVPS